VDAVKFTRAPSRPAIYDALQEPHHMHWYQLQKIEQFGFLHQGSANYIPVNIDQTLQLNNSDNEVWRFDHTFSPGFASQEITHLVNPATISKTAGNNRDALILRCTSS
jgi:hypothetical protein